MKYYQLKVKHNACRNDKEFWAFKTTPTLQALQEKSFMDGVPTQESIHLLELKLYSDCLLFDAHSIPNLYDAFFGSERLTSLISQYIALENQLHFRSVTLKHKGKDYTYFYVQAFAAYQTEEIFNMKRSVFFSDENQTLANADIRTPDYRTNLIKSKVYLNRPFANADFIQVPFGSLGNRLYCSERFMRATEQTQITGLTFLPGFEAEISDMEVPARSIKVPSFELQPKPNYAEQNAYVEYHTQEEWEDAVLEFMEEEVGEVSVAQEAIVKKLLTPTIGIKPAHAKSVNDWRGSRWFGQPSLPKGQTWPRTLRGNPLLFIGQINLAEVPENHYLPNRGMLLFFLDIYFSTEGWPNEPDRNKVIYVSDLDILEQTDWPDDLPIGLDFGQKQLSFYLSCTFPDRERFMLQEDILLKEHSETLGNFDWWDSPLCKTDRLLGLPTSVQTDVANEALCWNKYGGDWTKWPDEDTEIKKEALQWVLLLQTSAGSLGLEDQLSDPDIYFLIKKTDLEALQFDRTALVMQST